MSLQISASKVYTALSTSAAVTALRGVATAMARSPAVTGTPCGGPINITTGGTYSGCYQSTSTGTPAVTISTSQPVTLSRAHIIAKGNGVVGNVGGIRLTVVDSIFDQTNPGAVVDHRAVVINSPAIFDFQHNLLNDGDGVYLLGATVNPLTVSYNMVNNVGRYPHPTNVNCCVQFLQLNNIITPAGQIWWNHVQNIPGQSGAEDVISIYQSGGTDSAHRLDIGWNLIDGAYPLGLNNADFTGGGIMQGDGGGGHGLAHDNVVVSTTNYGVGVHSDDNYATNNLLVNDGAEQPSNFGQAVVAQNPTPAGLHATNNRYNWRRDTTNPGQAPCYLPQYCTGTQVSTTEQQARDEWEANRAAAGVIVGPRP